MAFRDSLARMSSLRFGKFAALMLFSILLNGQSLAQPLNLTPEQLAQLQALNPEQRAAVLQGTSLADPQAVVDVPVEVAPRPASDSASIDQIEANAQQVQGTEQLEEQIVETTTPEPLRQFGYELFAGIPTTFAPATNIPVPLNYVVGPTDTVIIQLYGQRNARYEIPVTREGNLEFPEVGPLNVAGLTFEEMRVLIETTVATSLIGQQVSVTMGALRSIQIFVLGEAFRPGSYTVSSLSTMTNALFFSGGVTRVGSLRDIRLMRQGQLITSLDLYDLLLRGDTSNDVRLQPNDVIFIPPIGRTFGIAGEVKRPAIFELSSEQTLAEALELAGGYLPTAFPGASRVDRINEQGERTLLDIDLNQPENLTLAVRNGDVLQIYSILDQLEGSVMLEGHVNRPGGFALREGMRVSDILSSIADMLPNPDLNFALIARETQPTRTIEVINVRLGEALANPGSVADVQLQARDRLIVFGARQSRQEQVRELNQTLRDQATFDQLPRVVSVAGNVLFQGEFPLLREMTLDDLVEVAGGLSEQTDIDYVLIQRQTDLRGSVDVIATRFDPQSLRTAEAVALQPLDTVYIFNSNEPRGEQLAPLLGRLNGQARFGAPAKVVSIAGNVRFPGFFPLHLGIQINELMDAAGWLNETTDLNYVLLEREIDELGNIEVHRLSLDSVTLRPQQPLQLQPRDKLVIFDANSPRTDLLAETLNKLRLQANTSNPTQIVSVIGNVRFPGNYPLNQGLAVRDLIEIAGGLTESADTRLAEITRFDAEPEIGREVGHVSIDLTNNFGTGLNLVLQPYDQLIIRQMANWTEIESVSILGEVNAPGTYVITKDEPISSLIRRAGGLTEYADPEAAVFLRESLRETEARLLQDYRDQLENDIITLRLQQTVVQPVDSNGESEALQMLDRIQTLTAIGRLVINLPGILNGSAANDVILRENDQLLIPRAQQEITVTGEVLRPTSHLYQEGLSVASYIEKSGGLSDDADRSNIYLLRRNGELMPLAGGQWFFQSRKRIEPGDSIVVPFDAYKPYGFYVWTNVAQIISSMATTLLLVDRIVNE